MLRFWTRMAAISGALSILSTFVTAACSGTSGVATVTPTTGIMVRAETLTAGRGCGRAPSQVFKYVVVVYREGDFSQAATANSYDCFADGVFTNLRELTKVDSYDLRVFAYNETAVNGAAETIKAASVNKDGFPGATAPTWTTRCKATELDNVQALATCAPLAPGLAGLEDPDPDAAVSLATIELPTDSFRLSNGSIARCAQGSPLPDGGDGDGGGGDGGDGGDADPPPTEGPRFTIARIRYQRGDVLGPTLEIACPATYRVEVPIEPASYVVAVGLADDRTNPPTIVPETIVCSAVVTGKPGEKSSATCPK